MSVLMSTKFSESGEEQFHTDKSTVEESSYILHGLPWSHHAQYGHKGFGKCHYYCYFDNTKIKRIV